MKYSFKNIRYLSLDDTAWPASRVNYRIPDHIPDEQVEKYITIIKKRNITKNASYTWTSIGWQRKYV